jgi:hypothetical protein
MTTPLTFNVRAAYYAFDAKWRASLARSNNLVIAATYFAASAS